MATNRKQKARAREQYANAVVEVLAPEFSDLNESHIRAFVVGEITYHAENPGEPLEVIVDSVSSANWRLRDDRDHPGRVRLASYRYRASDADLAREDRINEALRGLA